MFSKYTLRTRMILSICSVVILAFVITISYLTFRAQGVARTQAMTTATEMAYHHAGMVKSNIEVAGDAARTLAQSIQGMKDDGIIPQRNTLDAMMKGVLEGNPQLIGVWSCWEPDALDGKDEEYKNTKGHDATGRYISYWNKGSGKTDVEPLADYEKEGDGDYYQLCLHSGEEQILDPYKYQIGGQEVLITSIVAPIKLGDKVVGVAGVDMLLVSFQEMILNIKPYETGYSFLVSNKGTFVAHPQKDVLGKPISEFGASEEVLKAITGGTEAEQFKMSLATNLESFVKFVPISLGRTKKPWSLSVNIPMDKVMAESTKTLYASIGISLFSIILLTLVVFLIAKSITGPLDRIISNMTITSQEVSTASNEISHVSQKQAEGSTEQASSIEESSAALEELSSQANSNAELAKTTNGLMSEARSTIQAMETDMHEMVSTMDGIKDSSHKISSIIKTIEEIAFQTNLLALNAAVEAARAGEHGKGFAVVAEEVRNLAQRAATASKDTASLIEASVNQANKGAEVVGKTAEGMRQVATHTENVDKNVSAISTASIEQAQGVKQINLAFIQIQDVTQNMAASAEESASSASELAGQAQHLQKAVSDLSFLAQGNKTSQTTITHSISTPPAQHTPPPARRTKSTNDTKSIGFDNF